MLSFRCLNRTDLPPAHKPAPPPPKKKNSDMKGHLTSDDIQVKKKSFPAHTLRTSMHGSEFIPDAALSQHFSASSICIHERRKDVIIYTFTRFYPERPFQTVMLLHMYTSDQIMSVLSSLHAKIRFVKTKKKLLCEVFLLLLSYSVTAIHASHRGCEE